MKGIDISNHNGRINFSEVKSSGIELVYIKATEGTTYIDPYLNQHYNGAKALGLSTGFYHFLVSTSAPETQAENFFNSIKDKENNLKPCLDVEASGFNVNDYTQRFINRFKQLCNMDIVIYSGAYYSRDNFNSTIKTNYPLWVAHYGVEPWKSTINTGFVTIAGHQYTEKGRISGISTNVDLNVFNDNILISKSSGNGNNSNNDWLAEYLKSWDWNTWVRELQAECNAQGFSNQNVDGIVGPITLRGCPTLRQGARGNITKLLQRVLKAYGFDSGNIDGIFGSQTYNAVISFQKSRGLSPDGIVGRNTWSAILGI